MYLKVGPRENSIQNHGISLRDITKNRKAATFSLFFLYTCKTYYSDAKISLQRIQKVQAGFVRIIQYPHSLQHNKECMNFVQNFREYFRTVECDADRGCILPILVKILFKYAQSKTVTGRFSLSLFSGRLADKHERTEVEFTCLLSERSTNASPEKVPAIRNTRFQNQSHFVYFRSHVHTAQAIRPFNEFWPSEKGCLPNPLGLENLRHDWA